MAESGLQASSISLSSQSYFHDCGLVYLLQQAEKDDPVGWEASITMLLRCRAECKQCGKVSSPTVLSTNSCKEGSKEGLEVTQAQKAMVQDSGLTVALERAASSTDTRR